MKFEEGLRKSRRLRPDEAVVRRWRRAVFAPEPDIVPGWWPSLASGLAMAGMLLLLWPAAARGPVARGPGALRAGEMCDGRGEAPLPLRADVRGLARPQPVPMRFGGAERCALCHVEGR